MFFSPDVGNTGFLTVYGPSLLGAASAGQLVDTDFTDDGDMAAQACVDGQTHLGGKRGTG
jgi:hypothetical protein